MGTMGTMEAHAKLGRDAPSAAGKIEVEQARGPEVLRSWGSGIFQTTRTSGVLLREKIVFKFENVFSGFETAFWYRSCPEMAIFVAEIRVWGLKNPRL